MINTTIFHEFAHTLGLGHAHNKNRDLMCGDDHTLSKRLTCSYLPRNYTEPSDLYVGALLYSYGRDGFGGMNRELGNRPYHLPPSQGSAVGNQSGAIIPENKTGTVGNQSGAIIPGWLVVGEQ